MRTNDPSAAARTRAAQIKARARELGCDRVGIVPAELPGEERIRLEQWLARGYHGEMGYMARDPEQRTDPKKVFPDARSVVVVALNYYTEAQHSEQPGTGKVSRYAWGDDYHDIVGEKLRELLKWIKEQWPRAEGKVCVDIQPMMDKAWAVRAGIGWMGKHTNVITHEFGSWIFIGELLLNLDLKSDEAEVADQCGSCTLCIDACPTAAIVAPYVIDANLCISHATIESRAPRIREEVAGKLDGWLYGCDVCQDVCPWNHSPTITSEDRFASRADIVDASLTEILELTPEAYAMHFRGSAMKRAKLDGLKRNAAALLRAQSVRTGGVPGSPRGLPARAGAVATGSKEHPQSKH